MSRVLLLSYQYHLYVPFILPAGEAGLPELVLFILVILLFFRILSPPFLLHIPFLSNGYGFFKCIEIAMVT